LYSKASRADQFPMAKQALISLFREAEFALAAVDAATMPADDGAEVAFAGRSNSGKSTAINAIVGRRKLARASKTPGRTQSINFFRLGGNRYVVDLPGYGYAAASRTDIVNWGRLISTYITRTSLRGVVLVMDIRHCFTPSDLQLLEWLRPRSIACYVLLTKADKLSARQGLAALSDARRIAEGIAAPCDVQLFSGKTGLGTETVRQVIAGWLGTK
jgi:GTP-binding protein